MTSGSARWRGGGVRSVDRGASRTNDGLRSPANTTTGSAAAIGLGPSTVARVVRSSDVPRGTSMRTQPQDEGSRSDGPGAPCLPQQISAAFAADLPQHDRAFGSCALPQAVWCAAQPHHVHPKPEGEATTRASKRWIQKRGM